MMNRVFERPMPAGRIAKAWVKRLIGDQNLGRIDQFRFPERGVAWGGAFNGQARRRQLFAALLESLKPTSIVETGTYLGTTTELFGATGLPVFTVEADARKCGYAKARLRHAKNVHVIHGDSRSTLHRLLGDGNVLPTTGLPFVYLDAHWNDDLPLAEELDIVFSSRPEALVMVDDFEVPGDPDYGFDDYGPDKALNAGYIQAVAQKHALAAFYPRARGLDETGAKRGCIVLANQTLAGLTLQHEPQLRTAPSQNEAS